VIQTEMLVGLFGLRCMLLALTCGVAYAYSMRFLEFVQGRQTEDRLGSAIWLFALGNGATNINSSWLMIANPGEFNGSYIAVFSGLSVITIAHYLAMTAWAAYRYDHPIRRVALHAVTFLLIVGISGAVGFSAYLSSTRG
jgi:hypothetical protein